jgi:MATE family multidrug resistance protein
MKSNASLFDTVKEVFHFSIPLIAGQIGQMLFGIGDIMVAGRYSNEVLSALGIGTAIMAPFLMVGLGLTYAIGPLAAQSLGEDKENPGLLGSGLVATTALSVVLILALNLFTYAVLPYFNLSPVIKDLLAKYLTLCSLSLFPAFIYQAFKEYLQAYHLTYVANACIIFFNVVNILINYLLIFGAGPFPEMGIAGAAVATVLTRTGMALVLIFYTKRRLDTPLLLMNIDSVKQVLSLGLPISLGTLTEVLVFTTVTVLVGKMGVIPSAGHNIVLNLASLTFMVPLAISSAAAVKVGAEFGRKSMDRLNQYALACLTISIGYMVVTATLYFTIPGLLLRFATDDLEVIKYASRMLIFVALFQIPDGIQVTLWGILRGMGITKIPMILSLTANWLIGLPTGIYLATKMGMEASGYWAGLATGLYLMAFGLIFTYRVQALKFRARFAVG